MEYDTMINKSGWKHKALQFWRNYARPFIFIAIILTSFRSSIADWNDVPTGSMKPTILEGDRILVNKLAYDLKIPYTTWRIARWSEPQRGDVVVFFSPVDGIRLVKRIVAVPGDTIAMRDDQLIVNHVAASYGPLDDQVVGQIPQHEQPAHQFAVESLGDGRHPVMTTPALPALRSFDPIIVPDGHYFVMGDNRDNSSDSRYFGPVDAQLIVGRASRVLASLDRDNWFLPRWDRFLEPLP